MSAKYFLAVDGGGTKTKVLVADEQGQVVGEGQTGPTSITATSVGAASFNLREGIRQATQSLPQDRELVALCMGLAGMDTPTEEVAARKIFSDAFRDYHIGQFILVNDTVIGLEGNTDKPNAFVLIAGTGSACFGRNEAHQTAKASGYDFLLTDQGSGYWIGHQVLRRAVQSFDGTGQKTLLEQLVCQQYRLESILELKDHVYNPVLTKTEVAASSRLCSTAFEQNDPIAQGIFNQVINDLYAMAQAVVERLQMKDKDVDCVLVGSITKIPYINQQLVARLQQNFPKVQIKTPEKEPVYGGLKIALRKNGYEAQFSKLE
jgi:N-acetylglucosamine kinase-like BadF-type ATPase